MNVITCLPVENTEYLGRKNRKKTSFFKYIKPKTGKGFLHTALTLAFIASFTAVIILYLPFLKLDLGLSSIKPISFWEEPSVKNAMQEYSMPASLQDSSSDETENTGTLDGEETSLAEVPDFIPIVDFQNYIIAKGDTIGGIAYKFGLKNIGTLISANNISNVKRLQAGNKLKIPSIDGIFYTAVKGDSLSSIAAKFNLPVTAILDANDLENQTVSISQKLFIPGASIGKFELKKALGELFIYPITGRLTSPFGNRRDPFTGRLSFHTGIDIAAPVGTQIKATLDGTVAYTGVSVIYGNYVIISHGGGYQSMYGHLSAVAVKRGQTVNQGGIIGKVGNTGRSTGPHLHFSVYKNGKLINPLTVLK
ncbi:peptidoglycan DD-metalloendopeptidase family protein [Treponema pedis]|uniref:peptidoglycan DD-metalloendopeptidase family protein n=1 Tax=Treponema pedis TaxID=409322 RepID=UPI000428E6E9|nr:M23 family metallopeptidase [Treponema pedis]